MRDEFDARMWIAHRNSTSDRLTQISADCAHGLESVRDAFLSKARNVGFHGTAMIAAAAVSGTTILLTVAPVAGA